jgi:hypothetical protein
MRDLNPQHHSTYLTYWEQCVKPRNKASRLHSVFLILMKMAFMCGIYMHHYSMWRFLVVSFLATMAM